MRRWSRREFIEASLLASGVVACRHVCPIPNGGGDVASERAFEEALRRAEALAHAEYLPRPDDLPAPLRDIGYLTYQEIKFKPEAAVRLSDRFSMQLFHRGHFHKDRAEIFLQPREGEAKLMAYDQSKFAFGADLAGQTFEPSLGYPGFRIHDTHDEFLVFLDAAYFRLRGTGQEYGLSGRGVAIDTGHGNQEEFPAFTSFWIVEPQERQPYVDIVALMDGPSITGAYLFRAQPGVSAKLTVRGTIFLRKPVRTLGLAPLTSMFVHGSNGPVGHYDDFRPEVHDSDGLFLRTASEPAAWRPLINGRPAPRTSSFKTPGLESFALLQRQRRFDAYIDTRARYEDRPGVIVDVGDDFPAGDVRLYEIPSPEEYMDNIVAYVSPLTQPEPGRPLPFSYRLSTLADEPVSRLGQVIWTRIGAAERMRWLDPPIPGRRMYFIDWAGEGLPQDPNANVLPEVSTTTGSIVEPVVEYVAKTRGWRVYFEHRPEGDAVAELRATLHLDGRQIVETWLYGT